MSEQNSNGHTEATPSLLKRIPKSIYYITAGAIGVGVLLIGGGVLYTYWDEPEDGAVETESAEADNQEGPSYYEPSMEADEPAEDASVGVSVQTITSPVEPGSNATLEVRTLRGAECDIVVEYDEEESQDSGLAPRTASRHGMASWTWTVEEWVPEGEWPAEVTCSWHENSGMVRAEIKVVEDIEAHEE